MNRLSIPIAAMPIIVCKSSIAKKVTTKGDPSSLKDVIGERGKSTVVNDPKAVERLPKIINFLVVTLQSSGRKNAITPSANRGSIGVIRIANNPSTIMIVVSTTLRGISFNAEAILRSNHNSLRRTNARPKDIASAITTNGIVYSSDKDRNSIDLLQSTANFFIINSSIVLIYYNRLGMLRQLFHRMKQKNSGPCIRMLRLSVQLIR
jgi:hypothetical protein